MNQLTTTPDINKREFLPGKTLVARAAEELPHGRLIYYAESDLTQNRHYGCSYLLVFAHELVYAHKIRHQDKEHFEIISRGRLGFDYHEQAFGQHVEFASS